LQPRHVFLAATFLSIQLSGSAVLIEHRLVMYRHGHCI